MCKNNKFFKNYYLLKVKYLNNIKEEKKISAPCKVFGFIPESNRCGKKLRKRELEEKKGEIKVK